MVKAQIARILLGLSVAAAVAIGMGCVTDPYATPTSPGAGSPGSLSTANASGAAPCAQCRDIPPGSARGDCVRACFANVGAFCGGIAAIPCPTGLTCVLEGDFPDAGGRCRPH